MCIKPDEQIKNTTTKYKRKQEFEIRHYCLHLLKNWNANNK